MATVAELAAQEYQEVGYVLFIEGLPIAFTNRVELTGSGVNSWIGNEVGIGAGRTVVLGLETPPPIKHAIGLLDSGLPLDSELTFTIVDRHNHLIAFAADEAGTAVWQRLAPTDNPAPAVLIGAGALDIPIHDRWLNGERIGPSGERRQWQVIPGNPWVSYDHAAIDSVVQDLRASTVRTAPRFLEGLPCALYLIRRDPVTGEWAGWADQYDNGNNGYSLVWLGTLKALSAKSVVWSLTTDGPLSFLRKTLNANKPADWKPLIPLVEYAPGEDKIAMAFCYMSHNAEFILRGASSIYDPGITLTSGQTPGQLASEIDTQLQATAGTAGPDITYTGLYNGAVHMYADELGLKIGANNLVYGGLLRLRMHKKTWLSLGWDISLQVESPDEISTPVEVAGLAGGGEFNPPWLDGPTPDPEAGYWEAHFTTCPVGLVWSESPGKIDNDGSPRLYQPLYQGDQKPHILYEGAAQIFDLGFIPFYLEGQLARPPANKILDSGTCDTTGFFAVRGTYKGSLEGDEETHYQIGKVSWSKDPLSTAIGTFDSRALVWLEKFLDPKQFGVENAKLDYTWAANDLEYVPVALLGYNVDAPDAAHVVLLRLLLGSGTAGPWTGTEGDPNAALSPGDNAHPDASEPGGDDFEGPDLTLNIPHTLIDYASFGAAADALPGGKGGGLNQCRLLYVGPFDSQECLDQIIKPRGWCFSLKNGKFGLFARNAPLDADDIEVAITPADIGGQPGDMPPWEEVDFRPLEPIDLIEVSYGGNQLDGNSGTKTLTMKARDPRAVLRRGNAKVDLDGRTLVPTAAASWGPEIGQLWADQLARLYAEPWALVTVKVKGHIARNIFPGTVVSYTSPWMATRDSTYGKTGGIGRVVSVELNPETLTKTVEILLQAGLPATPRRFGPIARLRDAALILEEDRHNAATRTLYCYSNAFDRGGTASDVAAFAEPAWLGVGGDALAYVWSSWDGLTWEKTAEFVVESVNTAPTEHSITYKADTLSPSNGIPERRFAVITLAPWDAQDASSWPRALYGVVCGADTKFGAGNEDGLPWVL